MKNFSDMLSKAKVMQDKMRGSRKDKKDRSREYLEQLDKNINWRL